MGDCEARTIESPDGDTISNFLTFCPLCRWLSNVSWISQRRHSDMQTSWFQIDVA
jgi:hypothetical protein